MGEDARIQRVKSRGDGVFPAGLERRLVARVCRGLAARVRKEIPVLSSYGLGKGVPVIVAWGLECLVDVLGSRGSLLSQPFEIISTCLHLVVRYEPKWKPHLAFNSFGINIRVGGENNAKG